METENHGVPKEFPLLAPASVHTLNKFEKTSEIRGLKKGKFKDKAVAGDAVFST